MTLDEYKELIKFHILTSDINLSIYNYAAVDANGKLHSYECEPMVETKKDIHKGYIIDQWIPLHEYNENNGIVNDAIGTEFKFIYNLPSHPQWRETLIKL